MIYVYESRTGRFQTDAPTHHGPDGEDCRLIETRETTNPFLPGYAVTPHGEKSPHRTNALAPSALDHAAETSERKRARLREAAAEARRAAEAAEALASAAEAKPATPPIPSK